MADCATPKEMHSAREFCEFCLDGAFQAQHHSPETGLTARESVVLAKIKSAIDPALSEDEAHQRFAELVGGGFLAFDHRDQREGIHERPLGGSQDPGAVVNGVDPKRCTEGGVVHDGEAAGGEIK